MPNIYTDKLFSKKWFLNYFLIIIGSLIMASGYVFFINPYRIVPGGVYGISIVIHYLTAGTFKFWPNGIPIGLMGLVLNIPLVIAGIKILGPRFGIKTVLGFVLTSTFMDLITHFVGENDPLGLQDDILLCSVFGAVTIGFGLGLIFKSKASSGGSDIIAMILQKFTHLSVGRLLIYVDSTIVVLGLIMFRDWKIPLYSWLVIYITGRVIDITMTGQSIHKSVFIISDKYEEIRQHILFKINRGGTCISAKGMWQGAEKQVIFTVVSRRELALLQEFVKQVDRNAFITVSDTNEIIGEGFKTFDDSNLL